MMKNYQYIARLLRSLVALMALVPFVGCSTEGDEADFRETEYGYVQFKLYKEASYEVDDSRALKSQLDYLSEAAKVKVTLSYGETTIAQTLTLSSADDKMAEMGLRTDKLKLLTGNYQVVAFMLYDANDEPIYNGVPKVDPNFEVKCSGLTVHDLTVDVEPRGSVKFRLKKDLSEFEGTRAVSRQYTFDEIKKITITVQHRRSNEQTRLEMLSCKFSLHFNEDDDVVDYRQTSSIVCDTLLSLKAGDYRVVSYQTYDSSKVLLETKSNPSESDFTIEDNRTTETDLKVSLYESDEYIQDYYALKAIWESLHGEEWYYAGENYPRGANWDFNKDPDLWGDQPGVELHSNGRVARIDISDFAFSGDLSPAIGQLTQLVELYLGTHNDTNLFTYDPSLAPDQSLSERKRNRMANHGAFLEMIHPAIQLSEPCARALAEHQISIPATALYEEYSEQEIFDMKSGKQRVLRPMDTNHGTICNGLKSLPAEIGLLKNLEYFYVANSELSSLPDEMKNLSSLTDVEIYNCPRMTQFPMVLTQMPELVSLNLSNNAQWSPEEVYKGMNGLANGPAKEKIQILYARQNRLKELPESFKNMKKLGLLDMAFNQIEKVYPLTKEVAPVQLYLDNNLIEELPVDDEGYFCGYDDVETFSVNYNKLKKVPNIFSAESTFTIASVSFAGNEIDGFEGEEDGSYKGIRVETFTLSQNPRLTKYPLALAQSNSSVNYLILRACSVDEIPKGALTYERSNAITSLDLSYNKLTDLPWEFHAGNMPYFYGLDLSFNSFSEFPYEPLDCGGLTVLAVRSQRNEEGKRTLKEWPTGIGNHRGLRGLYLGSNDLREIDDTISTLIYLLDISDNPNIIFDASDICYAWRVGAYILIYDKTQNILNCDYMLE